MSQKDYAKIELKHAIVSRFVFVTGFKVLDANADVHSPCSSKIQKMHDFHRHRNPARGMFIFDGKVAGRGMNICRVFMGQSAKRTIRRSVDQTVRSLSTTN